MQAQKGLMKQSIALLSNQISNCREVGKGSEMLNDSVGSATTIVDLFSGYLDFARHDGSVLKKPIKQKKPAVIQPQAFFVIKYSMGITASF